MNSKVLSLIKNSIKKYLRNKEILDIIVFGSIVKGKERPNDIDIAIISNKNLKISIPKFHVSLLKPEDFFIKPPHIINTLFREGFSLKNNKSFSEIYDFSNKVLFKYNLTSLKPSVKVKIVNILKGKGKEIGLVTSKNGEWIANQVFIVPVENEYIFNELFKNFKIVFKKFYVLMH